MIHSLTLTNMSPPLVRISYYVIDYQIKNQRLTHRFLFWFYSFNILFIFAPSPLWKTAFVLVDVTIYLERPRVFLFSWIKWRFGRFWTKCSFVTSPLTNNFLRFTAWLYFVADLQYKSVLQSKECGCLNSQPLDTFGIPTWMSNVIWFLTKSCCHFKVHTF